MSLIEGGVEKNTNIVIKELGTKNNQRSYKEVLLGNTNENLEKAKNR